MRISRNRGRSAERIGRGERIRTSGTRQIRGCTVVMGGEAAPLRPGSQRMRPSTTTPDIGEGRDVRAVTTRCDGASVAVLRWLFDLVVIVGYFATALVLGSWLMVAAPLVLAAIVIVVTIVWVRLDES